MPLTIKSKLLTSTLLGGPVSAAAGGLFLDTYTGALTAYSFRKLRDAYAGSAVRIRRSSDNAEADIGFDVNGDFDTAAAASHIGGGSGFIVTWYDQSGNGNDLTQATVARQPAYAASGLNSLPTIDFAAASQHFLQKSGISVAGEGVGSAFVVASMDSATESSGGMVSLTGNSGGGVDWNNDFGASALERDTTGNRVKASQDGIGPTGLNIVLGTPFRFAFNHPAGTSYNHYVNGVASATATSRTLTWGTSTLLLTVGGRMAAADNNWDGQCSEIIFYLADQAANLAGIDADQAAYWG